MERDLSLKSLARSRACKIAVLAYTALVGYQTSYVVDHAGTPEQIEPFNPISLVNVVAVPLAHELEYLGIAEAPKQASQ